MAPPLAGMPWEGLGGVDLRGVLGDGDGDGGGRLKGEHLVELREMLAERNGERFRWLLDDDVELNEGVEAGQGRKRDCSKQNQLGDDEKIELLAKRCELLWN